MDLSIPRCRRCTAFITLLACLSLLSGVNAGADATVAYPFTAIHEKDVSAPEQKMIPLLKQAQKSWRLCVILPNLRDSYWSLVRYGLESQAATLNIEMTLFEAAGYEARRQQAGLIEKRCLGNRFDALLLASVNSSSLNDQVRLAHEEGLVVIDLINGISAPEVGSRVAVNYGDLAYDLGRYMAAKVKRGRVIWSPGPEGSAWAQDASAGFQRALDGSELQLAHRFFAVPFIRDQRKLLMDIIGQTEFNLVAGTAVTAEAAVSLKARLDLGVEVFSYYYSPRIHRLIRCGEIKAAVYEYPALQGRVAVDQAVRILERQAFDYQLSTARKLITNENIDQILDSFHMPEALIKQLQQQACRG